MEIIEYFPGAITDHSWMNNLLQIQCEGGAICSIEVYSPDIIRVRYGTEYSFDPDFSYAIDPRFTKEPGVIEFSEDEKSLYITTSSVKCIIDRSDSRVHFYDVNDNKICGDEKGFHWEVDQKTGNNIVQLSKTALPEEVYFGLGDKPCALNIRNKRFQNWGTDCYGYEEGWDPLYKNIPFYYGLHNDMGYGIFFDNSFRTFFDFGKERKNVTSFWAHGGELNYYFIAGPKLLDVNRRYSLLTGRSEMPALWALGFQQCKWSYYPESEVRDITTKMRELEIPCDAIYLDIDYMDGFRCFTWDNERFPDPKKMIDDLKAEGFKTVVIIDPGIKKDYNYDIFREGLEKGYFCRRLDGPYAEGKVWPGECYFPDFTREEVREWWADLYEDLIANKGVAGVWNDMNEPALFDVDSKTMPDDVLFDYDGHMCSHRKAHNVYGMQMARSTYEGVKKHGNNKRGLIITRSGYSGLQRYSSVWTGDNIANWNHVWLANIQCQRLSISGVPFAGSDIGGFIGQPTPEMFVRWIQLAIFHPFCRVHSSQDDGDQEPWSFGEHALDLFRSAVELRYRMLPYHYTAFYLHYAMGDPILKPLSFYDQSDKTGHSRDHEFICGDHILTASISEPNQKVKEVYLPSGGWYNYWTKELNQGGKITRFGLTEDTFPLFVKAGAILPLYPVQQYVDELDIHQVELEVYFVDGEEESYYYEDAHNGYEYQEGHYRLAHFKLIGNINRMEIQQSLTGSYESRIKDYKLTILGIPNEKNVSVLCDGDVIEDMIVPAGFSDILITW